MRGSACIVSLNWPNWIGLSRSTLLYYGKLGLIEAQRQSNGYRLYSGICNVFACYSNCKRVG
ncbi:MerR family DNA-binding transcriptional regulator [Vibrio chagasii]|nr:MerR family DNA-binding transcriptional regulator [Vibrio chagasii]